MARDYRAVEEEFIADLKSRSGRSLAEWMAAIDAKGLADRDEIIDWLHPQGFTFEHASWLERIHNNGGRPIYGDEPDFRSVAGRSRGGVAPVQGHAPQASRAPIAASPAGPPPSSPAPGAPSATPPAADPDAVARLLAKGKAYRMLAELIIAEARRELPGLALAVQDDLIAFCRPRPFALMAVTPKELRLGLALADRPVITPLVRPKALGTDPTITHMAVLNDARQVDETLIGWLRLADNTVNSTDRDH